MGVEPKRQSIAPEELCSLERLTNAMEMHGDALEQIATWRKDLTIRVRRAEHAEQEALERETAEFNRCCKVLGWRP